MEAALFQPSVSFPNRLNICFSSESLYHILIGLRLLCPGVTGNKAEQLWDVTSLRKKAKESQRSRKERETHTLLAGDGNSKCYRLQGWTEADLELRESLAVT